MVKLLALYRTPADIADFEAKYYNEHLPLALKMPGLIKSEITRLSALGPLSTKYFLQAELYFESMDKLNEAMGSTEGKAAAKNLMSFAKDYTEMMVGEVV